MPAQGLYKVARDSNPDINEMGRCWEDYSRAGSSMLRPRFGVTKTTMLHGQKAFPSLFRPICLRVQLSSPHMTRRSHVRVLSVTCLQGVREYRDGAEDAGVCGPSMCRASRRAGPQHAAACAGRART